MAKVPLISQLPIGVLEYNRDEKYDGDMKNDKKEGNGTLSSNFLGVYYYSNGDRYDGEWKDDKKHGKGKSFI